MSEKVHRLIRRQARETERAVAPTLEVINTNELITRKRVDALEHWAHGFSRMSRMEKLKWLLSKPQ